MTDHIALTIPKPTPGRIVLYRTDGRNGLVYDLPAVINCTVDSHPGDYPDGSHNPLPAPTWVDHVHLTVLTPGGYGTQVFRNTDDGTARVVRDHTDRDFVGAATFSPGSGTYVELDVPHAGATDPLPRSWRYPPRTDETIEVPA